MPRQMITIEVFYEHLDNNGDERVNPEYWPWEAMADAYEDEEALYYTRSVKRVSALKVEPLPTDRAGVLTWHEEHCSGDDCVGSLMMLDVCPMADEDDDE